MKRTYLNVVLWLACSYAQADVISHFNTIKNDPNALYLFFKTMPKGGELHYHLAGGSYAETMLKLAETGNYCLDAKTYAIQKSTTPCTGLSAQTLPNDRTQYMQTIQAWSMSNYVPGPESAHDHFFNSFYKFIPLVADFRPQLLADVIQRAADQHELYMEVMDLPDDAASAGFGNRIQKAASFDEKRALLLNDKAFQKNIDDTVQNSSGLLTKTKRILGCDAHPERPACQVEVRLIYYVLREQSPDQVFAQALNGFEAVSRSGSNLIGINLVQPENGYLSLRDYEKQMQIFNYLHQKYPAVHIALHAGELSNANATPKDLSFHVRDAIAVGHAERIGHGVDIALEDNARETLAKMRNTPIAVEVNLISNKEILQIDGKRHPLKLYLAEQVPVTLSTDDEGILRTDLTQQYVEAAWVHDLDYPTIKNINRNALTYSFLPGKSLWQDAQTAKPVAECQLLDSDSCKAFIKTSEKAARQWQLEQQLKAFEASFDSK